MLREESATSRMNTGRVLSQRRTAGDMPVVTVGRARLGRRVRRGPEEGVGAGIKGSCCGVCLI